MSPAEQQRELKALGESSSLPEKYGADYLFFAHGGWVGIQRKEMSDFVASVHDGRLAREVAQMQSLSVAMLLIEGRPQWTLDGQLLTKGFGAQWTIAQHRGQLWSAREKGIWVDHTENLAETVATIQLFERWYLKSNHTSLDRRPGPVSLWGKPDNDDYARHLVMGLPGVGPELASRIVDQFGVPFGWKVRQEDLAQVKGIGKVKARTIYEALENDTTRDEGTVGHGTA